MFCNRCKKDCRWKRAYERQFESNRNFTIAKNREITLIKNELHTLDMITELTASRKQIIKIDEKDSIPVILTFEQEFSESGSLSEFTLRLYQFDNQIMRPRQMMEMIVTPYRKDGFISSLFIEELIGAEGKGYGTLMMNCFFEYIKHTFPTVEKIHGKLVLRDLKHGIEYAKYLMNFYKKFGFEIYDIPNSQEKRIVLDLSKSKPSP